MPAKHTVVICIQRTKQEQLLVYSAFIWHLDAVRVFYIKLCMGLHFAPEINFTAEVCLIKAAPIFAELASERQHHLPLDVHSSWPCRPFPLFDLLLGLGLEILHLDHGCAILQEQIQHSSRHQYCQHIHAHILWHILTQIGEQRCIWDQPPAHQTIIVQHV